MASIRKAENSKCWWDVEKRNLCALLVGMEFGAAILENSMEISQKIKNRIAI